MIRQKERPHLTGGWKPTPQAKQKSVIPAPSLIKLKSTDCLIIIASLRWRTLALSP